MRIDIRSRNPIKDGEDVLGKRAFIKVVKNKVAPPFRRAEFDIMFGEGISKAGEILDLGVDYDIIKKSGSWFSYNGNKIAQGRDSAKAVIQDNPELAEELEAAIMEALRADDKKPAKAAKGGKGSKAPNADDDAPEADAEQDNESLFDDDELNDEFSIEEDI